MKTNIKVNIDTANTYLANVFAVCVDRAAASVQYKKKAFRGPVRADRRLPVNNYNELSWRLAASCMSVLHHLLHFGADGQKK